MIARKLILLGVFNVIAFMAIDVAGYSAELAYLMGVGMGAVSVFVAVAIVTYKEGEP